MKVASSITGVTVGLALRGLRISVTEKREAPLLIVASVCSSGETASPNGLGAPTLTSRPGGRDEAAVRQDRARASVDRRRERGRPIAGGRVKIQKSRTARARRIPMIAARLA